VNVPNKIILHQALFDGHAEDCLNNGTDMSCFRLDALNDDIDSVARVSYGSLLT
jgi:hypothetical protein